MADEGGGGLRCFLLDFLRACFFIIMGHLSSLKDGWLRVFFEFSGGGMSLLPPQEGFALLRGLPFSVVVDAAH